MKLYVVRHGETEWNKEEVFRGRKDVPLNETGRKQAEASGLYFRDIKVDRILASPLSRALETAQAINRTTNVGVETMDAFTDIDFGAWEGLPLREVEQRFPADFALWKASPQQLRAHGGETLAMVTDRIAQALVNIASSQAGVVVIVTHRVICKLIVLHLLRIGNEHFWDMKFDPASITLLERTHDRYMLVSSNDTCHLRAAVPAGAYRDF